MRDLGKRGVGKRSLSLALAWRAVVRVLAVVGLYNQFNKLVDGLQVEPDVMPDASW